jgi:hypothetical protein
MDPDIGLPIEDPFWAIPTHEPVEQPDAPYTEPVKQPEKEPA